MRDNKARTEPQIGNKEMGLKNGVLEGGQKIQAAA